MLHNSQEKWYEDDRIGTYYLEHYNTVNSKACLIKESVLIPIPNHEKFAKVLHPLYIQLLPVDEGYVATSPISDIYEQEASVDDVVLSYLYSLADELIWLQKQKENLSRPLLKQLDTIQSYLGILQ